MTSAHIVGLNSDIFARSAMLNRTEQRGGGTMTQRKKWSDLTTGQRMAGTLGAVLQITLLAAALWDIWHRPADEIKGDRRVWTAVSFVNFVGPIAYFLFGRKRCC
jgi:hypothetical protein